MDFPLLISPSFLQKIGIFQRGFAANISQANRGARFAVGGFQRGFGDLDLKKGVDHDLKLEKGEVWNKI